MEAALAARGYATAAKSTASPRAIEYQVFARITGELVQSKDLGRDQFPKVAEAVSRNLQLWTALAGDLSYKTNKLPVELKSNLLGLYRFTRQHTNKVLNGTADIDVLIDINTAVMKGLRVSSQDKERMG